MTTILKYILMAVSVVMIILILMQGGRADGLTSVITGSKSLDLFSTTKSRGTDIWFDRVTLILAFAFMAIVTVLMMTASA